MNVLLQCLLQSLQKHSTKQLLHSAQKRRLGAGLAKPVDPLVATLAYPRRRTSRASPRLHIPFNLRLRTGALKQHNHHHPISDSSPRQETRSLTIVWTIIIHSQHHFPGAFNHYDGRKACFRTDFVLSPSTPATLKFQHAATAASARGSRRE
jgi:hypothetical protein